MKSHRTAEFRKRRDKAQLKKLWELSHRACASVDFASVAHEQGLLVDALRAAAAGDDGAGTVAAWCRARLSERLEHNQLAISTAAFEARGVAALLFTETFDDAERGGGEGARARKPCASGGYLGALELAIAAREQLFGNASTPPILRLREAPRACGCSYGPAAAASTCAAAARVNATIYAPTPDELRAMVVDCSGCCQRGHRVHHAKGRPPPAPHPAPPD